MFHINEFVINHFPLLQYCFFLLLLFTYDFILFFIRRQKHCTVYQWISQAVSLNTSKPITHQQVLYRMRKLYAYLIIGIRTYIFIYIKII